MLRSYSNIDMSGYLDTTAFGKIMGKLCMFPKIFPFFLKIGELFTHFEKKIGKFWEIFSRFSQCVDVE